MVRRAIDAVCLLLFLTVIFSYLNSNMDIVMPSLRGLHS